MFRFILMCDLVVVVWLGHYFTNKNIAGWNVPSFRFQSLHGAFAIRYCLALTFSMMIGAGSPGNRRLQE